MPPRPPAPGARPLLVECRGVERAYGREPARSVALAGVDLRVDSGDTLAVVGPSGCGKSTLLHILGAMDRPDRGQVLFDGRDLAALKDLEASRFRREEIGFVFQFFNLIATINVLDNVALPARLAGRNAAVARTRASELLERVDLGPKASAYPDTLSGGQQQRVAIARALINTPRLLLADEPTGALDSRSGAEVVELLIDVVRERQAAIVMATHSDSAMGACERVLRMEDGRVRAAGAFAEET